MSCFARSFHCKVRAWLNAFLRKPELAIIPITYLKAFCCYARHGFVLAASSCLILSVFAGEVRDVQGVPAEAEAAEEVPALLRHGPQQVGAAAGGASWHCLGTRRCLRALFVLLPQGSPERKGNSAIALFSRKND